MLPENRSFMVRGEDGEEYGPVELDELREWVRENRAGLGTDVRLDETGAPWTPWQNHPELVALLAEAQATDSIPGQPGTIAPVWRRLVAWMMDIVILAILLLPLQLLLNHIIPVNEFMRAMIDPTTLQSLPTPVLNQLAAIMLIESACMVLYFTVCHAFYGKTPAKALLRVRVVNQNGEKPTAVKAFVRALVLVISVNLIFPLVVAFFNPQRRTLHDLVADTYVVEA